MQYDTQSKHELQLHHYVNPKRLRDVYGNIDVEVIPSALCVGNIQSDLTL